MSTKRKANPVAVSFRAGRFGLDAYVNGRLVRDDCVSFEEAQQHACDYLRYTLGLPYAQAWNLVKRANRQAIKREHAAKGPTRVWNPRERVGERTPKQASMRAIGAGKYDKVRHWLDGVESKGFADRMGAFTGRTPRAGSTQEMIDIARSHGAKQNEIERAYAQGQARADAHQAKRTRANPVEAKNKASTALDRSYQRAVEFLEAGPGDGAGQDEFDPHWRKTWGLTGKSKKQVVDFVNREWRTRFNPGKRNPVEAGDDVTKPYPFQRKEEAYAGRWTPKDLAQVIKTAVEARDAADRYARPRGDRAAELRAVAAQAIKDRDQAERWYKEMYDTAGWHADDVHTLAQERARTVERLKLRSASLQEDMRALHANPRGNPGLRARETRDAAANRPTSYITDYYVVHGSKLLGKIRAVAFDDAAFEAARLGWLNAYQDKKVFIVGHSTVTAVMLNSRGSVHQLATTKDQAAAARAVASRASAKRAH